MRPTFVGSVGRPLTVLVECDTGGGRCGVQSPAQVLALARQIVTSPGLRFGGLMTYPPRGKFVEADRWLGDAKSLLETAGIDVPVITSGNSPDIWHTGDSIVTERRPGTYIYFDRSQVTFGVASFADCALTVLATVVSRPTSTRAVIDAGSKSLSSDLLNQTTYGAVLGNETVQVASLSEEHGVIELPEAVGLATGRGPHPDHSQPRLRGFEPVRRGQPAGAGRQHRDRAGRRPGPGGVAPETAGKPRSARTQRPN